MAKKMKLYQVKATRPRLKMMVYADAGVGKTSLAATAQDHEAMKNVVFADIEKGTLSIAHRGDILRRPIQATSDLEALAWAIARGELPDIHTVVVDNITELQTINLQEIVQKAIAGGRNMVQNRQRTIDDVWQEDYLRSTLQLGRLIRFLRDLPINLIINAQLKRVYPKVPEGTDLTKIEPIAVVPSLSAKLMGAVMSYCDFVWCLEQETDEDDPNYGKRFAITVSKDIYKCKTRGPRFLKAVGEVIENPTLPEIYDTFIRTANQATKRSA
jgi:hypothetical protein